MFITGRYLKKIGRVYIGGTEKVRGKIKKAVWKFSENNWKRSKQWIYYTIKN